MQCITMRIDARHQSRHWYQNMSRTPIRDALKRLSSAPANPSLRHSGESPASLRQSGLVIPAIEGLPRTPIRAPNFHTFVCRHPQHRSFFPPKDPRQTPRFSSSYAAFARPLVIPAIKSTPRTPIRGRNPEGGRGAVRANHHSTGASSHPRIPDSSPFLPPHVALARS